jgi:hypothetical protein
MIFSELTRTYMLGWKLFPRDFNLCRLILRVWLLQNHPVAGRNRGRATQEMSSG